MNSVNIIGNLTADPESKTLSGGKTTTRLSIAVNRMGTEGADFFTVITWNKTAENCAKFLKKGGKVAVNGRLSHRTWEKDGQKRSTVEIVANQVDFLSSPKTSAPTENDDYDWGEPDF
jgi:single-strand DNA-binding protein